MSIDDPVDVEIERRRLRSCLMEADHIIETMIVRIAAFSDGLVDHAPRAAQLLEKYATHAQTGLFVQWEAAKDRWLKGLPPLPAWPPNPPEYPPRE